MSLATSATSWRLRTNFRLEEVYLYHLTPATPERSRAFFLDYVKTANELHEQAKEKLHAK